MTAPCPVLYSSPELSCANLFCSFTRRTCVSSLLEMGFDAQSVQGKYLHGARGAPETGIPGRGCDPLAPAVLAHLQRRLRPRGTARIWQWRCSARGQRPWGPCLWMSASEQTCVAGWLLYSVCLGGGGRASLSGGGGNTWPTSTGLWWFSAPLVCPVPPTAFGLGVCVGVGGYG